MSEMTAADLDEMEMLLEEHRYAPLRFDLLRFGSALIAAARRAERLHTFVSDIAAMAVAGQEIPDGLGAVCWRDALQAIARVAEHAALTPEPPQRPQERAHSPEAGEGV